MNKQSLLERRTEIETKFNELQKQNNLNNEEMIRLQGEYRTVNGFIEEIETPVEDANIINVEEKK